MAWLWDLFGWDSCLWCRAGSLLPVSFTHDSWGIVLPYLSLVGISCKCFRFFALAPSRFSPSDWCCPCFSLSTVCSIIISCSGGGRASTLTRCQRWTLDLHRRRFLSGASGLSNSSSCRQHGTCTLSTPPEEKLRESAAEKKHHAAGEVPNLHAGTGRLRNFLCLNCLELNGGLSKFCVGSLVQLNIFFVHWLSKRLLSYFLLGLLSWVTGAWLWWQLATRAEDISCACLS